MFRQLQSLRCGHIGVLADLMGPDGGGHFQYVHGLISSLDLAAGFSFAGVEPYSLPADVSK